MNAEILCIGTELLMGDIVNTNAAFLARQLAALGIDIFHQSVVGDNIDRLKASLSLALSHADMVITTGGLGPTYDDVTKKAVAGYFGVGMTLHEPSMDKIRALEKRMNRSVASNMLQAMVPEGSTVFFNDAGFAPGIALEKRGKTVIMLPGPPREMEPMFINKVIPYLRSSSKDTIVSKIVHIFGMGESQAAEILNDIMTSSSNPTIAPYAKTGEVLIRVSAKANTADEAEKMIAPVIAEIQGRLGDVIYGIDIGSLQNAVVQALLNKGLKAAAAESCTGGGVSLAVTDIPGSSAVFECGVCAYSNAIKTKLLGVSEDTLRNFGAFSPETAKEMARGVRAISGADIGVGVTGIAGPDGGSEEKPVGLVYVSVDSDMYRETKKLLLSRGHANERDSIRSLSVMNALSLILKAASAF